MKTIQTKNEQLGTEWTFTLPTTFRWQNADEGHFSNIRIECSNTLPEERNILLEDYSRGYELNFEPRETDFFIGNSLCLFIIQQNVQSLTP